jgi:hypothetical protein
MEQGRDRAVRRLFFDEVLRARSRTPSSNRSGHLVPQQFQAMCERRVGELGADPRVRVALIDLGGSLVRLGHLTLQQVLAGVRAYDAERASRYGAL